MLGLDIGNQDSRRLKGLDGVCNIQPLVLPTFGLDFGPKIKDLTKKLFGPSSISFSFRLAEEKVQRELVVSVKVFQSIE